MSGCDISVQIYGARIKIRQKSSHIFYLWGVLKHNIYSNKTCIENHLKKSIQNNKLCYYRTFLIKWNVVAW